MSNKDFTDFLLSEYEHISNAHFEMTRQVSIFLRYYLIIISAPAFIFLIISKDISSLNKLLHGVDIGINDFVGYFFLIISIVGLLMSLYIINIKHNGILYARVVNGIRTYFYSKMDVDSKEDIIRVLPKDISVPRYFKYRTLSIIGLFALVNSAYFYLFLLVNNLNSFNLLYSILFWIIHFIGYIVMSTYREKIYLKGK